MELSPPRSTSQLAGTNQEAVGASWFEIGPQIAIVDVGRPDARYAYEEQVVGPGGVGTASLYGPFTLLPTMLFANTAGFRSSLVVDGATARDITRVTAAFQGDPSQASGLYLRMLYLSATTITTLGIGDIQPISSAARTWVSAEAILGIVLAGLFLSAIGTRVAMARPHATDP